MKHAISVQQLTTGNVFESKSLVASGGVSGGDKRLWAVVEWDDLRQKVTGFYRVESKGAVNSETKDLYAAVATYNELP